MKLPFLLLLCPLAALGGDFAFSGNTLPVLTPKVEASTGLDALYVVNDVRGVSATYTSDGGAQAVWYRYGNRGGGFAEEITSGISRQDGKSTLEQVEGDTGYIIEDGDKRFYCWVVNYADHPLEFRSLTHMPDQSDCGLTALHFEGEAAAITYYSINGRGIELDRDIKLAYQTQKYEEATDGVGEYATVETQQQFQHLGETVYATAPLSWTQFTLSGDTFMQQWGRSQQLTTDGVEPLAVDCQSQAVQQEHDSENEDKSGMGDGLGGSAPCEVAFTAQVTEGAVFTEWQMSQYADFDDVQDRYQQLELDYTFRDLGTYYIRFMCADATGKCEQYGPTYTVAIGESMLLCPNAFSPNASEGVNDEWKVSYRSIVEFECAIFNRNGVKMTSFTDPSQGWDGKYKGKFVPAGAYFYVIKAKGADGKKYELGGDINIVGYK